MTEEGNGAWAQDHVKPIELCLISFKGKTLGGKKQADGKNKLFCAASGTDDFFKSGIIEKEKG
ncbi:hypothetical protein [Pontibacter beigongshangensis]|uniref:hypothetical protein n=1 Tax=Pontibacter beigongshangensis TaxID=2574733 RepID=UPI00165084B7|nr:hypothetical protein [Pontibacter beigongshangensis]